MFECKEIAYNNKIGDWLTGASGSIWCCCKWIFDKFGETVHHREKRFSPSFYFSNFENPCQILEFNRIKLYCDVSFTTIIYYYYLLFISNESTNNFHDIIIIGIDGNRSWSLFDKHNIKKRIFLDCFWMNFENNRTDAEYFVIFFLENESEVKYYRFYR